MQDFKSVCLAVVTHRQTNRQLLTGYAIEHVYSPTTQKDRH